MAQQTFARGTRTSEEYVETYFDVRAEIGHTDPEWRQIARLD